MPRISPLSCLSPPAGLRRDGDDVACRKSSWPLDYSPLMTMRKMRQLSLGKRLFLYCGWSRLSSTLSEQSIRTSWPSVLKKKFILKESSVVYFMTSSRGTTLGGYLAKQTCLPWNRRTQLKRKTPVPYRKSYIPFLKLQAKL